MAAKMTASSMPDTYFKLVRQLPLAHIRNDGHLDDAQTMIDQLLKEDLDAGTQEYLSVLTDLVEAYEDEHVPIPDASEADVLGELIRANSLTQLDLSKKVGISQSTISAVIKGTRTLTKDHIITLAKFFHVSPAAFLPR